MSQIIYILPSILVLISALGLMFMSMYENKFSTKTYIIISSLSLIAALILALIPFGELYSIKPFKSIFNNVLIFDNFSNFFNILLIAGTLLTLLIGEHYFQSKRIFKGEFFSILLFALFGMMLLANANELITAYIALEIASFAVYIMVGYDTEDSKRVEAMFKYLVLGSIRL